MDKHQIGSRAIEVRLYWDNTNGNRHRYKEELRR